MEIIWLPGFTVDATPISNAVWAAASTGATTICQLCVLLGGTAALALSMQHPQPFPMLKRGYHHIAARHPPAWLASVHT